MKRSKSANKNAVFGENHAVLPLKLEQVAGWWRGCTHICSAIIQKASDHHTLYTILWGHTIE